MRNEPRRAPRGSSERAARLGLTTEDTEDTENGLRR
jgi:hypothetical protein